ncbi:hypothetical protein Goshw_021749 [Gossypium schwendimanii]|uniref:Mitochondrial glycoprotein n=2 Tax=Gossypium TaxID=3633 RepID=A0A7J9MJJ9_GOSSC|nr:hypothetical protein [Gossypium schwendimanii]
MAFASVFRKSANALAPLAIRLTRVQRNYHSSIFRALNHRLQSQKPAVNRFYPNSYHFSTAVASKKPSSDESLIRVLESEIQFAEGDSSDQVVGTPSGFPFEVEDNPGTQTVTLTREYNGELIKVDVHMLDLNEDEQDEDEVEDNDGDNNNARIPFVVTVSKKDGPSLEFSCTALHDGIGIDSLSFRNPNPGDDELAYEGPDFNDLDENLQKGFYKYLEVRGIKPSTTNYLREYMADKDNREYLLWLKNLKKFVEE